MSTATSIEWTRSDDGTPGATWNPIAGCSIVSPGCKRCYAMRMAARIEKMQAALGKPTHYAGLTEPSKAGAVWNGKVAVAPDAILTQPLRWKRPRRIFVNSMSDLFHEGVELETIVVIFTVMELSARHTYQVLTKRSARMAEVMNWLGANAGYSARVRAALRLGYHETAVPRYWPPTNVWLGVSTEDQARADERIPHLLATPAAVRWISAEPLIGPLDLTNLCTGFHFVDALRGVKFHDSPEPTPTEKTARLDWVVAGGESGPGARAPHVAWFRRLRDQCAEAGVPYFFKQHGDWIDENQAPTKASPNRSAVFDASAGTSYVMRLGKGAAGNVLDGRTHQEWPR